MARKESTISMVTSSSLETTAWFDPDVDMIEAEAAQQVLEQLRSGGK